MEPKTPKLPESGGVQKARERMKKLMEREPSPELIDLINENNDNISGSEESGRYYEDTAYDADPESVNDDDGK